MAEIIVVGYQNYDFAKSLIVGEIVNKDFCLDLKGFDALIFTSKNAIFSLESNAQKYPQMQVYKQIPSYVIGNATAKALEDLEGNLVGISPNAHGGEFTSFLKSTLNPKSSLLYLRAEKIVSKLDEILENEGFCIHSQIAYRSQALNLTPKQKPPKGSILLFTSPSAYKFFIQNFSWESSYTAIALGKTTYQSFDSEISKEISSLQDIQESTKLLQSRFSI